MISFELTTDTPEEMITLLRGLKLEVTKDEPVREVQEEATVHDGDPEQLQAEERLGEAPEKAEPDEDLFEAMADALEDLANEQTAENRMTLIQAAKAMRLIQEYVQESLSGNIDLALRMLRICRPLKKEKTQ